MGLVGMKDCDDAAAPCHEKSCINPTVDVVTTTGRHRLKMVGHTTVWTHPDYGDAESISVNSVALAPSFEGGMVVAVNQTGGDVCKIYSVNLSTGATEEELADLEPDEITDVTLAQEASVVVGFITDDVCMGSNAIGTGHSITPEGLFEEFQVAVTGPDVWAGVVRIGEYVYVWNAEQNMIHRGLIGAVGGGDGTDWLDTSPYFTFPSGTGLSMLMDDARGLLYLMGLDDAGEFVIHPVTPGDTPSVGAALFTPMAGVSSAAETLLPDGIWWVSGGVVYRYNFATEAVDTILTGTGWPTISGQGCAFIVGSSDTCNDACACGPDLTMERIFDEGPSAGSCDADPGAGSASTSCCTTAETVRVDCIYTFAYVITLCEGRLLSQVIFQGHRYFDVLIFDSGGTPFGLLSEYHDGTRLWADFPLEGRFFFIFTDECGVFAGTLRVTVIDDADCCKRLLVPLLCCQCCPVVGDAPTLEEDPIAEADCTALGGSQIAGTHTCLYGGVSGCFVNHLDTYWKITAGAIASEDCSDTGLEGVNEDRGCWQMEYTGVTERDGGTLPSILRPGEFVRIKHDGGGAGVNGCVKMTPADSIGGEACNGEPHYLQFDYSKTGAEPECGGPDPNTCTTS